MKTTSPLVSGLLGFLVCTAFYTASACGGEAAPDDDQRMAQARRAAAGAPKIALEKVYPELKLERPLLLLQMPDKQARMVVLEQAGRIQAFGAAGTGSDARTFLDLRSKAYMGHNEEGLLGMAFHPKFAENRTFFVYYSVRDPRRTVVTRFTMRADNPELVDAASEKVILEVPQPYGNHKGGHIAFGPDGFLYIGLGDGGSGGDPHGHGQDTKTLLGSLLRIDVDRPSAGHAYGIPADNPFADGKNGAPEIFAWGLRNPWRFSFDRKDGRIWVGDVGQNRQEEIDIVEKGKNYGWNIMEGELCYEPEQGCKKEGLVLPVAVYGRREGISVTGGHVYRGKKHPTMRGWYLYGDYGSGRIWGLNADAAKPGGEALLLESGKTMSSFAEDLAGEVYLIDHVGAIYRVTAR